MNQKELQKYWEMTHVLTQNQKSYMQSVCDGFAKLDRNRRGREYNTKMIMEVMPKFFNLEHSIRTSHRDELLKMMLGTSPQLSRIFDLDRLRNSTKTLVKRYNQELELQQELREGIQKYNIEQTRKHKEEKALQHEAAREVKDRISYDAFSEQTKSLSREDLIQYLFNMHMEDDVMRFLKAKADEQAKADAAAQINAMLAKTGLTVEDLIQYTK